MDLQAVGAYSPDVVYGQLSSPFEPKQFHINAHTPYDKVDETENKAVSRESFLQYNKTKMKVKIGDDNDRYGLKYPPEKKEDSEETTTKNDINYFSYSTTKKSKDIVSKSLKNGYSVEQAITMAKAEKAYKNGVMQTNNAVKSLSQCSYKVS